MQARIKQVSVEVPVEFSSNTKTVVVAYVDPDAFSILNGFYTRIGGMSLNAEDENSLIKQIVATLKYSNKISNEISPIYISRIILNSDGSYDILTVETDLIIKSFYQQYLSLPINATITDVPFTSTVLEKFCLRNMEPMNKFISDFQKKQDEVKLAKRSNSFIISPPQPILTRYEFKTFTIQNAEEIFPNVKESLIILSESIAHLENYKSEIEKKLTDAKSAYLQEKPTNASKEVTAVYDRAKQEWEALNAALVENQKAVDAEISKRKQDLAEVEKSAREEGLVIAEKRARVQHAKELLLWALYNAAGNYYQELLSRNTGKDNKSVIEECNKYFSTFVKVGDDGNMYPITDTYDSYNHRSLDAIAQCVNTLINECNTALLGDSSKIKTIAGQLENTNGYHLQYNPAAFKLENKRFSWHEDALKEEQALTKFSTSDDLTNKLAAIKSADLASKESQFRDKAINCITAFQQRMAEKRKRLDVITAAEEAVKEIRSVQELLTQLNELSKKHSYLSDIINPIKPADNIKEAEAQIARLQQYAQDYSAGKYNLAQADAYIRAIKASRLEYYLKHTQLTTLIKDCESVIAEQHSKEQTEIVAASEHKEEPAVEREHQAAPPEEPKVDNTSEISSNEEDNQNPEVSTTTSIPKTTTTIRIETHKEPGFFQRHLGKIIGGIAGFLAGAGPGAVIGAFFAPATFGLSIPVCAVIGGIIGAVIGGGAGVGIGAIFDSNAADERKSSLNKSSKHKSPLPRIESTTQIQKAVGYSLTKDHERRPVNSSNPILSGKTEDQHPQSAPEPTSPYQPGFRLG